MPVPAILVGPLFVQLMVDQFYVASHQDLFLFWNTFVDFLIAYEIDLCDLKTSLVSKCLSQEQLEVGIGCASENAPGVYTRVENFLDFIEVHALYDSPHSWIGERHSTKRRTLTEFKLLWKNFLNSKQQ